MEPGKSKPLRPESELPGDSLVILPLRNTVVFPSTAVPLSFGRPASTHAIQEAVRRKMAVGIIGQRDPKLDVPKPEDLYQVGTVVDVVRQVTAPDGQLQLLVQGRQRFKILDYLQTEPFLVARVFILAEAVPKTKEFEARILHLRQEAQRAWSLLAGDMLGLTASFPHIDDPSALVDFVASVLDLPVEEKQGILETVDLEGRAQMVSDKLARPH